MSKFIVGITGASGSIYAARFLEELNKMDHEVHLIATDNGKKVFCYEMDYTIEEFVSPMKSKIILHDVHNLFAPIASGSFKADGMVILPCSMSTMAEIACGVSKNLLGRAADVCIKEKRKLILVPRETPLSSIHLRNMLTLSECGASILPAMPGFYSKPKTLDDIIYSIVGRTLDFMGIENDLYLKWGEN
ncbi:MAG: 3-octaprenyl-4-hydroxybenzoate carboxy-lyase [Clostridiales bacterium]|jgi:4-hydroxy-3-polyprenylbenzoate decarboxylase|nr:3-octaprenyl-4-hydroxybenzoate carboxy-lyase [Clostridiales bacterium]